MLITVTVPTHNRPRLLRNPLGEHFPPVKNVLVQWITTADNLTPCGYIFYFLKYFILMQRINPIVMPGKINHAILMNFDSHPGARHP